MDKNNNKSTHYRGVREEKKTWFHLLLTMQMTNLLADTLMLYVSRKVLDIGIFKQDITGPELCLVYKNKLQH